MEALGVARVNVRLPFAGLLVTLSVALVSADGARIVATGIQNPTCELVRAGV
jgi:hypothetical protein